jgi:outer membrane protein TolC
MKRAAIAWIAASLTMAYAQELTISSAVEQALRNYPAIRVSQAQMDAAAAGIELARTSYLPRVDALAQVNRATRNNVFGMLLPNPVIPSMSGPVLGTNNGGTVWGSAVGALATWEPFDFGLRRANVDTAAAARAKAAASLERTRFEIGVATADAFLTIAAAEETFKAAEAARARALELQRAVGAQVKAELRPGADRSRTEADLAAAKTQVAQAQQAIDVARANLAQFSGADAAKMPIRVTRLGELPTFGPPATIETAANPAAKEQSASIEQAKAQLYALQRTYFPRFYLQGAAYARGTGAELDGKTLGWFNGLGPTTQDYALGFSVSFPILDFAAIRSREAAQAAAIRAEQARYQQITNDLVTRWNIAKAQLEGARRVAENTPTQVTAARTAFEQANARYGAGLGTIVEVAEAQRLLAQAGIDDALARLSVWRALLGLAAAQGDIRPFLSEVSQ